MKTICIFGFAAMVLFGSPANAAIDGQLGPGDSYGSAIAVQDAPTAWGDNVNELNAAFAAASGGDMALLLTGNLEGNGNGLVLLLDVRSGGAVATTLAGGFGQLGSIGGTRIDDWGTDVQGGPGVSPTPGGSSILDPSFNPDVAIEINASGGVEYYVNIIDLTLPNEGDADVDRFLGQNFIGAGPAAHVYGRADGDPDKGSGGLISHAFNNSNLAGISDVSAAGALTATTGVEMLLSAEFLAVDPGHGVKAMVFLTNGGGEYLSNQFLGQSGVGVATALGLPGDVGGAPLFDAREFAGNQFFVIAVPEPAACGPLAIGLLSMFQTRRTGRGRRS